MKRQTTDESGIIIVVLVFIIALIVFGIVAYNSITKSREADENDSATPTRISHHIER